MSEQANNSSSAAWQHAAEQLLLGELVGFPTETVLGIGADPFSGPAVKKLLEAKSRAAEKGFPLVAASIEDVFRLPLQESEAARGLRISLAEQYWPGPLSLVLQLERDIFAKGVAAADGSIAVRVSTSQKLGQLAEEIGGFLIASSANPAGEKVAEDRAEFQKYFKDLYFVEDRVEVVGQPSTIVDPRGGTTLVLRDGALKLDG